MNNNVTWDRPRSRPFADAVAFLHELGYVSAYHAFFDERFGLETRQTHRHNNGRGYHIDLCFVPIRLLKHIVVSEPAFEGWRSSDHVPLVVDLPLGPERVDSPMF